MATSGPARSGSIEASFDDDVWAQEVERLRAGAAMRSAAERARQQIAASGVPRAHLRGCEAEGPDRTRLAGCLKVYAPLSERAASERPNGFVFELAQSHEGVVTLRLLAFGERHPRPGTRSVYERAHKRLHGRYPDQ